MKKRSHKRRKILIIIAVLLAGIITGTAAFGYIYFTQGGDSGSGGFFPDITGGNEKLDRRVSVLLVGADKRPGETAYNADTLIVASVDPDTNIISLLSIPRDTRITIGSDSFLKINSAVMHRGVPELVDQVEDLTGIELDGYVVTNFDGFKGIIDTLGGIDIYVERKMGPFYTGDEVDGLIDLDEGQQRMNGSMALQYARWRNDGMADIGRTARQQKVLMAIAKEGLQASTIAKIPQLIPQVMGMVETDLKLGDLLKLAKPAASFDSSNIVSQTLPGVGLYLDGISFWEVNRDQARETVQNLLLGITSDRVIDNKVMDLLDPNIKEHITVPGSSSDPNGTASPGHDVPDKGSEPNQGTDGDGTSPDQTGGQDGTGDQPSEDAKDLPPEGDDAEDLDPAGPDPADPEPEGQTGSETMTITIQ